ncbi:TNFAIP3-interacting protein 3 isoform X1 [Manis javanica]|uniref:TNFAIP3-interacting protein 3 isoform X1 n=2 Tax=Manis javanica TaxID=9974 RepID=UPI003C6CFE12
MFTDQPEDSERCESMELDNKIRDLIERNMSPDLKSAMPSHRNPCSLKSPGKPDPMAHCIQGTITSAAERSTEQAEGAQSSSRKNLTDSLEQKIKCLEKQRKELLEVNQQWDQHFRSMKESYERKGRWHGDVLLRGRPEVGESGPEQGLGISPGLCCLQGRLCATVRERLPQVAELKTKLGAAGRLLGTLETERQQRRGESERQRDLTRERLRREEKEKENLNKELHELKKENKLLKEKNALSNRKKEHYECEIKRLNKALQDALKIECSSFPENCSGKFEMEFSHEQMRTEMEVLKQQVQIYEEDFQKERSDRERLNQEKEELQQINQMSQSQLNKLNSQIKTCQMEKEKLEKQLKQMYFPTCNCDLGFLQDPHVPAGPGTVQDLQKHPPDCQWYAPDQFPPDVQHKANEPAILSTAGFCGLMRPPRSGLYKLGYHQNPTSVLITWNQKSAVSAKCLKSHMINTCELLISRDLIYLETLK